MSTSEKQTVRVLLDNGTFIHSEFATTAVKRSTIRWGGVDHVSEVQGLARKPISLDPDYQLQKDALFTVGRLICEGRIEAFKYWEIECEGFRGTSTTKEFNALRDCRIQKCDPAIQRSKFRQSVDLTDVFSKGGKKDIKKGIPLGQANQISFFKWLLSLRQSDVELIVSNSVPIRLSRFEIESFRDLEWFKFICQRSGSPENYPDVFHLWTAKRNNLDALLTLEKNLPKLADRVRSEKSGKVDISVEVLRPLDLLTKLGIDKPDPVPMQSNRFYYLHDVR
jgi:hypothetical protein